MSKLLMFTLALSAVLSACTPIVSPTSSNIRIYSVGGHDIAVADSELENRYVSYHNSASERTKTGDDFLTRNLEAIKIASNCQDIRLISNTNGKTEAIAEC